MNPSRTQNTEKFDPIFITWSSAEKNPILMRSQRTTQSSQGQTTNKTHSSASSSYPLCELPGAGKVSALSFYYFLFKRCEVRKNGCRGKSFNCVSLCVWTVLSAGGTADLSVDNGGRRRSLDTGSSE